MPSSSPSRTSTPCDNIDNASVNNGIFSFGIIADVQWADAPDGTNYAKTVRRHYRGALGVLSDAVDWWDSLSAAAAAVASTTDEKKERAEEADPSSPPTLSFVAQLGDLIDGKNNAAQLDQSERALQLARNQLDRLQCPTVSLIGNHELYNFDRASLTQKAMEGGRVWLRYGDKEYYSFHPAKGWRIVVLDSYQLSLMGYAPDDPRRLEAIEIVTQQNPNVSPDGKGGDWFKGMDDTDRRRRFAPYNGGYGREQLDWLRLELASASESNERVILLSHNILHPRACGKSNLVWDYDDALEIIRSPASGGCVAAVLSGHDHKGYYHCDKYGVHHCTFASPLNKGRKGKAFGLMKVTRDWLELQSPAMNDWLPDAERRPLPNMVRDGNGGGRRELYEVIRLPLHDTGTMITKEEMKTKQDVSVEQESIKAA